VSCLVGIGVCFEPLEICVVKEWVKCFTTPNKEERCKICFYLGQCLIVSEIVMLQWIIFEVVEFKFYRVVYELEDLLDVRACPFWI